MTRPGVRRVTPQGEASSTLSKDMRDKLHELVAQHGSAEKLLVILRTSRETLDQAMDPGGRLRPATVARLVERIKAADGMLETIRRLPTAK